LWPLPGRGPDPSGHVPNVHEYVRSGGQGRLSESRASRKKRAMNVCGRESSGCGRAVEPAQHGESQEPIWSRYTGSSFVAGRHSMRARIGRIETQRPGLPPGVRVETPFLSPLSELVVLITAGEVNSLQNSKRKGNLASIVVGGPGPSATGRREGAMWVHHPLSAWNTTLVAASRLMQKRSVTTRGVVPRGNCSGSAAYREVEEFKTGEDNQIWSWSPPASGYTRAGLPTRRSYVAQLAASCVRHESRRRKVLTRST
jgi:hypothetical protein